MDTKFDSEDYGINKLIETRDKYHAALEPVAAATKSESGAPEAPVYTPQAETSRVSGPKHPAIQEQLAHVNPSAHAEPELSSEFEAGSAPEFEPEAPRPAPEDAAHQTPALPQIDHPILGAAQVDQTVAAPSRHGSDSHPQQWQPPAPPPAAPGTAPHGAYGAGPAHFNGSPAPFGVSVPQFAAPPTAAPAPQFQAPAPPHQYPAAPQPIAAAGGYPGAAASPNFTTQGPPMMGAPTMSGPHYGNQGPSAPNHGAPQSPKVSRPWPKPGVPAQQHPAQQQAAGPPEYVRPTSQPRDPWQAGNHHPETDAAVKPFALKDPKLEKPKLGWRALASRVAPVGKGDAEVKRDREIQRINKVFRSPKIVGVLSFKGGVGKTTVTVSLGSTIASLRHEGAIVAIDAVARGTLAMRVQQESEGTIKGFAYAAAQNRLHTDSEIGWFLATNDFRLRILASDNSKEGLLPHEYADTVNVLAGKHRMILVDMDPSSAHPSFETIMRSLDALVLVVPTSIGGAERGRDALQWMRENDLGNLPTLVLINQQSPAKPNLDVDELAGHFRGAEGRETLIVKWDPHLAEEGPISLNLVNKTNRRKLEWAAALLMDMLPGT